MTFVAFSKRWAVLVAPLFSLLLCASAQAEDYVPLEDVTKLEKPTICLSQGGGLYLIDWDGQNERLWMTGDFTLPARFSRDGKYAWIQGFENRRYTPFLLELKTGRVVNMRERLDNIGYEHISISGAWWFPDGRRLACRGKDLNGPNLSQADIFLLDLRNEKIVNLTNTQFKDEFWATVSADGKKIAFSGYPPSEEERAALGIDNFPRHLYTMSPNGRNVVNLTNSAASYKYPEWSPDGKKIAFEGSGRPVKEEGEPNGPHLFIINPDGSNLERLTFPKDGVRANIDDWSGDSKWVLYTMSDGEALGSPGSLYRIHIETREIVRIGPAASARWVYAGKSRFLSVDPAGKKHGQWGDMKEAEETATPLEDSSKNKSGR